MGAEKVLWVGPCFSYSGYGTHNRKMALGLSGRGYRVSLLPTEDEIPARLEEAADLLRLVDARPKNAKDHIAIACIPPASWFVRCRYNILFTTIESVNLHPHFGRRADVWDEVWVPSEFNRKALIRWGMSRRKVRVVPEGFDIPFWSRGYSDQLNRQGRGGYFYYLGDWSHRKGMDLIVQAWRLAGLWRSGRKLVLRVHYPGSAPGEEYQDVARTIWEMLKREVWGDEIGIEIRAGFLSKPDLRDELAGARALVHPTRGEAWGQTVGQALLCGVPAITAEEGGQRQYLRRGDCLYVKTEGYVKMDDLVRTSVSHYQGCDFVNPSLGGLVRALGIMEYDREKWRSRALAARARLMRDFSWGSAVDVAGARIEKIWRGIERGKL